MTDPSLYDLIHKKKKLTTSALAQEADPFEFEIEKVIKQHIDVLIKEQDPEESNLLSSASHRLKLEYEIREALNFSELGAFIGDAINILQDKGLRYLTEEEYALLMEDLDQLHSKMIALKSNKLEEGSFKAAYSISNKSHILILKLGIAQFEEGCLTDSLAVLTFLTTLDIENSDYAYRLGIIAQKNKRYDLALLAYNTASNLDPTMVGAYLFATQCYLCSDQLEDASKELARAKNALKTSGADVQQEWNSLVNNVEDLINKG